MKMKKLQVTVCFLLAVCVTLLYHYYECKMDLERIKVKQTFPLETKVETTVVTVPAKKQRKLPEIDDSFLAKLRRQGHVKLPEKDQLERMDASELTDTLHSYLRNTDIVCSRALRMGNIHDGGWEVCDDEEYRPIKPCLVYSFGIQNDFSFDDYTATNYGCEVVSFDPSMTQASYQRSTLVKFVRQGVSHRDVTPTKQDDWEMHTVTSFKQSFGHSQRPLDILKMDVEGTEWTVLAQVIQSGEATQVRQLLVEFHLWNLDKNELGSGLKVLKDLYDLGFRKYYTHKNPACVFETSKKLPVQETQCYEVHFVNTNMVS